MRLLRSMRELMTGTAEDTFAPELAATRGMVVSILHRLAGSPTVNAEVFADVAVDDWYGQAVAWARVKASRVG